MALEEWHIYLVIGLLALNILVIWNVRGNNVNQDKQLRDIEQRLEELIEVQRGSSKQIQKNSQVVSHIATRLSEYHFDQKEQLQETNLLIRSLTYK